MLLKKLPTIRLLEDKVQKNKKNKFSPDSLQKPTSIFGESEDDTNQDMKEPLILKDLADDALKALEDALSKGQTLAIFC